MNHVNVFRAALFAAVISVVPSVVPALGGSTAQAQPAGDEAAKERAKQFYIQGRKDYDLGNFEKAVENFKKAFGELEKPEFLFNIAQSYRQLNDCKNALFFYKRFLSKKTDASDTTKKEVEGHIKALEECIKTNEAIRNRQPDGTETPSDLDTSGGGGTGGGSTTGGGGTVGGGTTGGTSGDGTQVADNGGGPGDVGGEPEVPEEPEEPVVNGPPKLLSAHAGLGGASIGAGPVEIPVQFAISLSAGYPIAINDQLVLDVGIGGSFTPVPWSSGNMEGSATMTGVFVNAGGAYEVVPKISLRADVGGGLLLLGGLKDGNPFTPAGSSVSGTLTMPLLRAGISGEYALTNNVAVAVTPVAFSYSPPKTGMREDIDSLTRLEFLVGLGYRM